MPWFFHHVFMEHSNVLDGHSNVWKSFLVVGEAPFSKKFQKKFQIRQINIPIDKSDIVKLTQNNYEIEMETSTTLIVATLFSWSKSMDINAYIKIFTCRNSRACQCTWLLTISRWNTARQFFPVISLIISVKYVIWMVVLISPLLFINFASIIQY